MSYWAITTRQGKQFKIKLALPVDDKGQHCVTNIQMLLQKCRELRTLNYAILLFDFNLERFRDLLVISFLTDYTQEMVTLDLCVPDTDIKHNQKNCRPTAGFFLAPAESRSLQLQAAYRNWFTFFTFKSNFKSGKFNYRF